MESGSEDLPEEGGTQSSKQALEQPEHGLENETGASMPFEETQKEERSSPGCPGTPR
jgi:hypothetical protein